jgi:protein SCO1
VVVVGFGFTHCPEICPTTLSRLAKARKSLGEAGRDLQVVYVTVDPERDSPAQMGTYLANFDATFIGGTGKAAQLDKVYRDYGVIGTRNHSTSVYLIDREGRLRAMVPYGKSAEDIAHDAGLLLAK